MLEDELAVIVGEDAGAGGVGESLLDAGDQVVGGGFGNLRTSRRAWREWQWKTTAIHEDAILNVASATRQAPRRRHKSLFRRVAIASGERNALDDKSCDRGP